MEITNIDLTPDGESYFIKTQPRLEADMLFRIEAFLGHGPYTLGPQGELRVSQEQFQQWEESRGAYFLRHILKLIKGAYDDTLTERADTETARQNRLASAREKLTFTFGTPQVPLSAPADSGENFEGI